MGVADRRVLWDKVVREEETFRDAFKISLESVAQNKDFDDCVKAVRQEIKFVASSSFLRPSDGHHSLALCILLPSPDLTRGS
jgi:hypothetical protein